MAFSSCCILHYRGKRKLCILSQVWRLDSQQVYIQQTRFFFEKRYTRRQPELLRATCFCFLNFFKKCFNRFFFPPHRITLHTHQNSFGRGTLITVKFKTRSISYLRGMFVFLLPGIFVSNSPEADGNQGFPPQERISRRNKK